MHVSCQQLTAIVIPLEVLLSRHCTKPAWDHVSSTPTMTRVHSGQTYIEKEHEVPGQRSISPSAEA